MAWVVDTYVAVDVWSRDPIFCPASAACLFRFRSDGLTLCPVSYVEMAPSCQGNTQAQERFLTGANISFSECWTHADTLAAHRLWHDYFLRKRGGAAPKRPLADVLIAAFALRFQGIVTRNRADFAAIAPGLNIVEP